MAGACCLEGWDCRDVESYYACTVLARQTQSTFYTFDAGESCAALRAEGTCDRGVCCYDDGSYNCDYTDEGACIRSGVNSGRAAHWVRGPCEADTCN